MNKESAQKELWASGAENWKVQEATFRPLYETIIKSIPIDHEMFLLDIGCGTGFFLSLLMDDHWRLSGVDISPNAISIAKKAVPDCEFKVADMEHLPFPDSTFDIIVANNSFQYSNNFSVAMKEIFRVLKPNGNAVFSLWDVPEKSESYAYFKVFYTFTGQDTATSIPFNLSQKGQLEALLLDAGFRIGKRCEANCPRMYPNIGMALRGILSSGPANKAIKEATFEKVEREVVKAIRQFEQKDGSYRLINNFFFIQGTKISEGK